MSPQCRPVVEGGRSRDVKCLRQFHYTHTWLWSMQQAGAVSQRGCSYLGSSERKVLESTRLGKSIWPVTN